MTDPTENVLSALKNLKDNGMIITIPGEYEFPRSVQPYIKNLVELEADKFIPMVLKVCQTLSRPTSLLKLIIL